MPHKKNPILSREPVRARAPAARRTRRPALEDVALWHERDISHSSVERVVDARRDDPRRLHGPRARPAWSTGLVVHAARMRANLERTGGLYFSEAVLLALVKHGPAAPGGVRAGAAQRARGDREAARGQVGALPGRFRELLGADPDIAARLDAGGARRALRPRAPPAPRAARSSTARSRRNRRHEQIDRRRRASRAARARRSTQHAVPAIGGRRCRLRGQGARLLHRRDAASGCIVVTDRLSAFDVVLGTIPFKGQVLNQLAHVLVRAHASETNYSKDKNLWHLSHEGLDLEFPENEPKYDKILRTF